MHLTLKGNLHLFYNIFSFLAYFPGGAYLSSQYAQTVDMLVLYVCVRFVVVDQVIPGNNLSSLTW